MLTDAILQKRVLDELRWDTRFDATKVGVEISDGSVTLSGHVSSYAQKQAALEATKGIKAVKAVADNIEVNLSSDKKIDDSEIAKRIAHVLSWNTSLPSDSVKAEVRNGFVTLTGKVDSHVQQSHLNHQIMHISGVRGISNQVTVDEVIVPDNIHEQIQSALERSAKLEAEHVKVNVSGHTVILNGKVKAYYERELIEKAAWLTPGVRDVINEIEVA